MTTEQKKLKSVPKKKRTSSKNVKSVNKEKKPDFSGISVEAWEYMNE